MLNMDVVSNNYTTDIQFEVIQIWGLGRRPSRVYVDEKELSSAQIDFDSYTMVRKYDYIISSHFTQVSCSFPSIRFY